MPNRLLQAGLLLAALPGLAAGHVAGIVGAYWRLLRAAYQEGLHSWLPEPQDGEE